MKGRKKLLGIGLTLVFFLAIATLVGASAQEKFPTKPITLVVPWAAGGGQDGSARAIAPHVGKFIGQPVVIVNKPGAATATGHRFVQESKPDGYTLVQTTVPINTLEYLQPSAGVSYKKFEPIVFYSYTPAALLLKSDAPWKTLKEVIDYAKANPGKLRIANTAHGGIWHFSAIALEKEAGLKITHLSTKGSADAVPAVLGGHVDALISGPGDVLHLVKGGKLKMVAIAEPERSKYAPDVPTFKEFGLDIVMYSYYSWLGPKGIPEEKVNFICDAVKKAADMKGYREYCENQGVSVALKGPKEFTKFLDAEDKKYKKLIEESGIKAQ